MIRFSIKWRAPRTIISRLWIRVRDEFSTRNGARNVRKCYPQSIKNGDQKNYRWHTHNQTLQDCLKLHLPTSYTSVTLLTRGFFEVLFMDEEGAKSARKIIVVEWSSLNLSFFRYIPNFEASVQGAETLFLHTIKVQFPNLHEQFRNTKTLTIMASKIGKVLEI